MFISIYVYVFVCICVFVCCVLLRVVVCNGERSLKRNVRRSSGGVALLTCQSDVIVGFWDERLIELPHTWFPPNVSLRRTGVEQLSSGKANDWRNRKHVVLDLFSNLQMGKIQRFLW